MLIISETVARELMTISEAIVAVESVFTAEGGERARSFDVVREELAGGKGVFGVKSGHDLESGTLGLKAGGYWFGNRALGIGNHQSFTLLFDENSGVAKALVSANYATGARTAAAAAIATKLLARPEANALGLIGAGGQALFQIEAILSVRHIERLLIWSRTKAHAQSLADAAAMFDVPEIATASASDVCRQSDIITTITPSTEPIVMADWIKAGTHVNVMGADTRGKQECETQLLKKSRVYVDSWDQAMTIGECQTAYTCGEIDGESISGTLGQLLNGKVAGRVTAGDITLFDSTGIALQDLAVANLIMSKALARRVGSTMSVD